MHEANTFDLHHNLSTILAMAIGAASGLVFGRAARRA